MKHLLWTTSWILLITDIPILLDIDVDKPDKKLIIMYLTELYNYLEGSKAKEREVGTSS